LSSHDFPRRGRLALGEELADAQDGRRPAAMGGPLLPISYRSRVVAAIARNGPMTTSPSRPASTRRSLRCRRRPVVHGRSGLRRRRSCRPARPEGGQAYIGAELDDARLLGAAAIVAASSPASAGGVHFQCGMITGLMPHHDSGDGPRKAALCRDRTALPSCQSARPESQPAYQAPGAACHSSSAWSDSHSIRPGTLNRRAVVCSRSASSVKVPRISRRVRPQDGPVRCLASRPSASTASIASSWRPPPRRPHQVADSA